MEVPLVTRAINNNVAHVRWNLDDIEDVDVNGELEDHKCAILNQLIEEGRRFDGNVKWYVAVIVEMMKTVRMEENSETTFTDVYLHGKTKVSINLDASEDEILEKWEESVQKINESLSRFVQNGSGWTVSKVKNIDLNIVRYRPLHGASSTFVETPLKVAKRKAIVNVKNPPDDNKCFLWSVLAYLLPAAEKNRFQHRYFQRYIEIHGPVVNMEGIEYPVKIASINRFEKQNPNIAINVYGYEEEDDRIYPLRVTEHRHRQHVIHLLMLSGETRDSQHYCLINTRFGKNGMSRLLTGLTKSNAACHYCPYCLHRFSSNRTSVAAKNLEDHIVGCKTHGLQRIKMPEQNSTMAYKDYSSTLRAPYVIYADFESFIVPIHTTTPKPNTSFTNDAARHMPSGYCYLVVNEAGETCIGPNVYRATSATTDNVVERFLNELLEISRGLYKDMTTERKMNQLSYEQNKMFREAELCFLCETKLNEDRVRHHSHTTGKFLGPCHSVCNQNCKITKHIPVIFHNLRGYDCHHIVKALGSMKEKNLPIKCIANTSERIQSLSIEHLRFLDSFQFMSSSLEKLVDNLAADCEDRDATFSRMTSAFPDSTERDCLIRKGVYPYEYMTDETKFSDRRLPDKRYFFSALSRDDIADKDYRHAQRVWEKLKCNDLGQYHDVYLKSDVLLLADVFENFRDTSMRHYGLDPCHFFSTPHFSWNAMLKKTKQKLELLTDIDMHLFVEQGTRGGVAMISNRYASANNPAIPDQYDPTKPASWIQYYDCNNLYGTAMVESLPFGGFRWLTEEEVSRFDLAAVPDEGVRIAGTDEKDDVDAQGSASSTNETLGYFLEVDLHYPDELHDMHNDYPLAPERKEPTDDMISPHVRQKNRCKVKKLLTTLDAKRKYVVHYRNLKQYTELGLKVTAIHRVLQFKQSPWLKSYIDFNTQRRAAARNNFEKDYFKLLNNAVYGKSLENVRNRIDFRLVVNEDELDKIIAKPRVKSWYIYAPNVVGVCCKKTTICLNRPIYVGFSVLELSKRIMYNFHYNYMVKKYDKNIKLLMTDTDSLMYEIITENVYDDLREDQHLFDTSDYPMTHACYSPINKRKLGCFKDEMNGSPIREFVGLRAKMYSVLQNNNFEKKVAKGVPRVSIKFDLKHEMYKRCLMNNSDIKYTEAYSIRSKLHDIFTTHQSKLSLTPFDDKRYILADRIHTLAYGHYKLNAAQDECNKRKRRSPSPQPSTSSSSPAAAKVIRLDNLK